MQVNTTTNGLTATSPLVSSRALASSPITSRSGLQAKKNTILVSHGRPPWYGEDGRPLCDAFVIGVAGGSASGKTFVAQEIVRAMGSIPTIIILSQDSFYNKHSPEEIKLAFENRFDFDHPDAIDMPLFAACLADLKSCKQANIPMYSFKTHQRLAETKYLYGAAVIIVEGIMALTDATLRDLYDLKIFVQCDSDLMLARRIKRDVAERGRSVEGVLEQYLRYVKPAYDNFVGPSSRHADIIVPGLDNSRAITLITTHIRRQLDERSLHFRTSMVARQHNHFHVRPQDMDNLRLDVLPQTPQLKGIFTILRDENTTKQDFIFFTDRLATILAERAVNFLPHTPKTVTTPLGVQSHGKALGAKGICGVSILRSGGPLERGLQRVLNDVPIGSLLVQSDARSGEPLLLHVMLPKCIRERHLAQDAWVFLLDAQVGTAASAFMAIRTLLDHGCRQDHIIFVTFLVAKTGGIYSLKKAFPGVTFVCGAVDDDLRELWLPVGNNGDNYGIEASGVNSTNHVHNGSKDEESHERKVWVMEPGMGQIGDRYYL